MNAREHNVTDVVALLANDLSNGPISTLGSSAVVYEKMKRKNTPRSSVVKSVRACELSVTKAEESSRIAKESAQKAQRAERSVANMINSFILPSEKRQVYRARLNSPGNSPRTRSFRETFPVYQYLTESQQRRFRKNPSSFTPQYCAKIITRARQALETIQSGSLHE